MRIDNTIADPNLSLVLPGGCTGKCKFCFWTPTKGLGNAEYGKRLRMVLNQLPDQFTQISLTGGEPTSSLAFGCALSVVAAAQKDLERFHHVVLTTNGSHLHKWVDDPYFLRVVKHVNISRHHYDWQTNLSVFGSPMIAEKTLIQLCEQLAERGIDVTLNAVITPKLLKKDIVPYVEFAKRVGASAVCFRKRHTPESTLAPTTHEEQFSHHKVTHHSACPVCRSDSMIIKGMTVHWKASVFEPSNDLGEIYELILHANGRLTSDWAGEHGVRLPRVYSKRQRRETCDCEGELVGGCKGSANIKPAHTAAHSCHGGLWAETRARAEKKSRPTSASGRGRARRSRGKKTELITEIKQPVTTSCRVSAPGRCF